MLKCAAVVEKDDIYVMYYWTPIPWNTSSRPSWNYESDASELQEILEGSFP